ncbi:hypothetical protein MRB53_030419 [Persea americana]|uniref:Uncharacterized protein n=1 Tax=Persea americana TaxID=3435 RepID=A0ACC2KLA0_PERAE|nr:hypothetical protein MRB53_030419 [Persea americana]
MVSGLCSQFHFSGLSTAQPLSIFQPLLVLQPHQPLPSFPELPVLQPHPLLPHQPHPAFSLPPAPSHVQPSSLQSHNFPPLPHSLSTPAASPFVVGPPSAAPHTNNNAILPGPVWQVPQKNPPVSKNSPPSLTQIFANLFSLPPIPLPSSLPASSFPPPLWINAPVLLANTNQTLLVNHATQTIRLDNSVTQPRWQGNHNNFATQPILLPQPLTQPPSNQDSLPIHQTSAPSLSQPLTNQASLPIPQILAPTFTQPPNNQDSLPILQTSAPIQEANSPSLSELPYEVVSGILQKIPNPSIDISNPFSILVHCSLLDPTNNPSIYGCNLQASSKGNSSTDLPPGFHLPPEPPNPSTFALELPAPPSINRSPGPATSLAKPSSPCSSPSAFAPLNLLTVHSTSTSPLATTTIHPHPTGNTIRKTRKGRKAISTDPSTGPTTRRSKGKKSSLKSLQC